MLPSTSLEKKKPRTSNSGSKPQSHFSIMERHKRSSPEYGLWVLRLPIPKKSSKEKLAIFKSIRNACSIRHLRKMGITSAVGSLSLLVNTSSQNAVSKPACDGRKTGSMPFFTGDVCSKMELGISSGTNPKKPHNS